MINKPTVLILGAGASIPFGYPSGLELKRRVIDLINSHTTDEYRVLNALGYHTEQLKEFQQALHFSGRPSVDAFLEHRPELIPLGKACMALALVKAENPANLFTDTRNWYDHLFMAMTSPFERFPENHLAVVTFNYDRSLEQYLYLALRNAYGRPAEEVFEILRRIPIVHVHGQLGQLPWQADMCRPYAPTLAPGDIKLAADGIRVISEVSEEYAAFEPARQVISGARRIIFLGFGFHQPNFDRLKMEFDAHKHTYYATAFGLTTLERARVSQWFSPLTPALGETEWDALQFLREKINLS